MNFGLELKKKKDIISKWVKSIYFYIYIKIRGGNINE